MAAGQGVNAHESGTPSADRGIADSASGESGNPADLLPEPRIEGPLSAPLITVHADLSCPDCALVLERLGRIAVRIDLRHFVLRSRGEPAMRAAAAAEAAGRQGAFWPFARGLLTDQGRQDPPHLWSLAEALGLDVARFDADRRSEAVKARIAQETRAALLGGATGVPAVFADASVADYLVRSGYDAEVRIRRQK